MKIRSLLIAAMTLTFFQSHAQFSKITETNYYMSFEPLIGSLKGTSNIATGVNPNLTLQSQGLMYGIDWNSSRWTKVDGDYLVPKIQCPIRVRYMNGENNKGLKTSDGTFFPEEKRSDSKDKPWAPFSYMDFSIDLYISPYYFKAGSVIVTPKFGFGVDLARHKYNVDLSKYLGKTGTVSDLGTYINDSYSPFYSYTFWEDLYGINLGSYVNVGKHVLIDAGWEYYPGRFMTKLIGNTINSIWDANPGTSKSKSSKNNRFCIKGQYRILSWVSVFAKYEYSNYQFEGPIIRGDQKFYQKYSNLMFGVTLGGAR